MRLYIQHETRYRYATPASYSIQLLRLTPRQEGAQRSLRWQVRAPGRLATQTDANGNTAQLLTLEGQHQSLTIAVEGVVDTDDAADGRVADAGLLSPLAYVMPTPLTQTNAAIDTLAAAIFGGPASGATSLSAMKLMRETAERVRYRPGTSAVSDTADEAMTRGSGVCQDQTHVALAVCRAAGIPARYVSGYLLDDSADGRAAATHAWMEIWLAADNCWLGCDITHGSFAGANLCRLAIGRDYLDAAPVRGMRRGGGAEELTVAVSVSSSLQP